MAAHLLEQLKQLTISNGNETGKVDFEGEDKVEQLQKSIWIQLPDNTVEAALKNPEQQRSLPLGLGDVVIEWSR